MSTLRFIPDLFIGVPELEKLKKSLKENGFITTNKALINNFGVAIHKYLPNSLRVVPGSSGKITIRAGIAIDSNFENIIVEKDLVNLAEIPEDGREYFITIQYKGTPIESGTVSVLPDGTMTGVDTEFMKLFRGEGSRLQSRVKFSSQSGPLINQGEYSVSSVETDTLAYLNVGEGVLAEETNLNFSVLGTFTPDVAVAEPDKMPYINDSFQVILSRSKEIGSTTIFLLASAVNNGGIVTITDLRDENLLSCYDNDATSESDMIGVESCMYGSVTSGGLENSIKIGWGFESPQGSWSVDTSGEVSVSSLYGGIVRNFLNLNTDIRGWRLCFPDGKVGKILEFSNVKGTLKLQSTLTSSDVSGGLLIVPDTNSVEILAKSPTNGSIIERVSFDASMRYGILKVESGASVQISYRLLKGNSRNSEFLVINNGSYYPETSYDEFGNLISQARQPYANGTIITKRRQNSLIEMFNSLIPIGAVIDLWAQSEDEIPPNYINCDGRQVKNSQSPLFGIYTPDYRGRSSHGIDPEQPEFSTPGTHSGSKSATLTIAQLPKHKMTGTTKESGNHGHKIANTNMANSQSNTLGNNTLIRQGENGGGNQYKYILGGTGNPATVGNTSQDGVHSHSFESNEIGGGQAHSILGPSIAMYKIMRIL